MNEQWTEVITPKTLWFELKLGELWRYRDLMMLFVKRDFMAAHKQTVLGWLWHVITPFINILLYTVVFNKIAQLDTEGVPPILFQAVSYTIWAYFVSCFSSSSGVLMSNASLFSKVYFPRMSVALSSSISAFLRILIQFMFIIPIWIYYAYQMPIPTPTYHLLFLPIILIIMTVGGIGAGCIMSAITVKYRDLSYFVGYAVAAMMYGSAVLYPLSQVPESFRDYVAYNPLVPLMEATRYAFFGTGTWDWAWIGFASILAVIVFVIGQVMFHQAERTFIDNV